MTKPGHVFHSIQSFRRGNPEKQIGCGNNSIHFAISFPRKHASQHAPLVGIGQFLKWEKSNLRRFRTLWSRNKNGVGMWKVIPLLSMLHAVPIIWKWMNGIFVGIFKIPTIWVCLLGTIKHRAIWLYNKNVIQILMWLNSSYFNLQNI